jgi:geranylgeranyl diphosphate synthase type I
MDGDNLRRGIKTVHYQWNLPTAINAGDALFARAFEVLCDVDLPKKKFANMVKDVARMTRRIAEGQQWDMDFETRRNISEEEYLKMIEYKTAVIFACAAKYGAMIAGGSKKQIEAMTEYGRLLGIGFQIWDDYLDLKGEQSVIGKPVGSDIKRGKNTLIVVHALKHAKEEDKHKLLSVLGNANAQQKEISEAVKILENTGSIEYARNRAYEYAKKGKELLKVLPDSKAKETLAALIDYMVQREK